MFGEALEWVRYEAPRLVALFLSLVCAMFVVGCAGYTLDGKVVAGPMSSISVVSADDPRFDQPGLGGVTIEAMIDPDKLSREHGGSGYSDGGGTFSIPISQIGAGMLEYDVRVVAQSTGFKPAAKTFALPGDGKRLLITLQPGEGRYLPPKNDILQDTIDKSKPYLNN